MLKSTYLISKMDCPSEVNMIRIQLDGLQVIKKLEFDIENRNLTIFHLKEDKEILSRLEKLNLGAKLIEISSIEDNKIVAEDSNVQLKLLWSVLIINFGFFIIEMTTGLISKSMGLVADSLDMLADSFVYGLSLWAVGSTAMRKKKVALLSGYFQLTLALLGIIELTRRFISSETMPDYRVMIGVSIFALIANAICLYLLQKVKSKEAHIKASMIFTSNDVIINAGVIIAGVLVLFTQSKYPDLIVGTIVFLIVIRGAVKILNLGK
ncbi:MAG: cation transporter [Bacteroidota bacterium]|nr:MAG: cation transporter [Bacteroidota bacterium]